MSKARKLRKQRIYAAVISAGLLALAFIAYAIWPSNPDSNYVLARWVLSLPTWARDDWPLLNSATALVMFYVWVRSVQQPHIRPEGLRPTLVYMLKFSCLFGAGGAVEFGWMYGLVSCICLAVVGTMIYSALGLLDPFIEWSTHKLTQRGHHEYDNSAPKKCREQ